MACEIVKTQGMTSKEEVWYCLTCRKEVGQMCQLQSQAARELMLEKCKEFLKDYEFVHIIRVK